MTRTGCPPASTPGPDIWTLRARLAARHAGALAAFAPTDTAHVWMRATAAGVVTASGVGEPDTGVTAPRIVTRLYPPGQLAAAAMQVVWIVDAPQPE